MLQDWVYSIIYHNIARHWGFLGQSCKLISKPDGLVDNGFAASIKIGKNARMRIDMLRRTMRQHAGLNVLVWKTAQWIEICCENCCAKCPSRRVSPFLLWLSSSPEKLRRGAKQICTTIIRVSRSQSPSPSTFGLKIWFGMIWVC